MDQPSDWCSVHAQMTESHVAHQHTFTHRTNKHAVYYTPLDYIGFNRFQAGCFSMWIVTNIYFSYIVLLCGKSHICPFFGSYISYRLNTINKSTHSLLLMSKSFIYIIKESWYLNLKSVIFSNIRKLQTFQEQLP